MNRILILTAVILLGIILPSCETAKFPIDSPPNVKIDNRLLGTWRANGKHEEFTLLKQSDNEYLIMYKNKRHNEFDKYPAFLSNVDGATFLNIFSNDDKEAPGYYFLKIIDINTRKNEVTIANVVDSTIKTIAEPAGIRERISKHLTDPAFYSDTTIFFRLK